MHSICPYKLTVLTIKVHTSLCGNYGEIHNAYTYWLYKDMSQQTTSLLV